VQKTICGLDKNKLGQVLLHTRAIRKKDQKRPIARHFSEMTHLVYEMNFETIEQITLVEVGIWNEDFYRENVKGFLNLDVNILKG